MGGCVGGCGCVGVHTCVVLRVKSATSVGPMCMYLYIRMIAFAPRRIYMHSCDCMTMCMLMYGV